MDKEELIKRVKELIADAKEELIENSDDRNSYGHGYDIGRLEALREALELLEE